MSYVDERGNLVLSTGREISCSDGRIGLAVDRTSTAFRLSHGYDGEIQTFADLYCPDADELAAALSLAECKELAEFMIGAWQAYHAALIGS